MKHNARVIATMVLVTAMVAAAAAAPAPAATTAAPRPDFSGVWQVADSDYVRRPDVHATEADYTPEAWANLLAYKRDWNEELDDPVKYCVAYGMPNTLLTRARDYVVDIQQSTSRITVLVEYMDNRRVLHLDRRTVPETANPSNNGYSVAHFDGQTLLVETTNLKARNVVGPMQRSDQARITERWTLRRDSKYGEVIDIDVAVIDPMVFRHPVKARQMYKRAPADATLNEYACADALWDDHVNEVLAKRAAAAAAKP
jgi:hypothetical protein